MVSLEFKFLFKVKQQACLSGIDPYQRLCLDCAVSGASGDDKHYGFLRYDEKGLLGFGRGHALSTQNEAPRASTRHSAASRENMMRMKKSSLRSSVDRLLGVLVVFFITCRERPVESPVNWSQMSLSACFIKLDVADPSSLAEFCVLRSGKSSQSCL